MSVPRLCGRLVSWLRRSLCVSTGGGASRADLGSSSMYKYGSEWGSFFEWKKVSRALLKVSNEEYSLEFFPMATAMARTRTQDVNLSVERAVERHASKQAGDSAGKKRENARTKPQQDSRVRSPMPTRKTVREIGKIDE